MSSYSFYDGTIVYLINGCKTLSHILTKAEQHCKDKNIQEEEFIKASLAPDMKPLSSQIQIASDTARKAVSRLTGSQLVSIEDNESTFAELQERVAKTLAILTGVKKEDFDFDANAELKVPFGANEVTFTKKTYAQIFFVPNFYFHVVTAYGIMRMKGVDVGKTDFIKPAMS